MIFFSISVLLSPVISMFVSSANSIILALFPITLGRMDQL